ncbi:hypothetical protein HPB50_026312 [Hyalomma asiaticum]|uniref:Uncharacterized protein n=1 Tax=Hyalomma asiaticum TaxID=266040 RepID=A0ACB7SZV3_HYAAI|nr:hypothetical protein HPB50_026312 [Hyalomma asiaticum]
MKTHTEDLLKLEVRNTAEEIAEIQERAQLARLSTTAAGKRILDELAYPSTRGILEGRRNARAVAILKQIKKHKIEASFVDAAEYSDGKTFAFVVDDSSGKTEQAAIALVLLDGRGSEIYGDSKTAVRAFQIRVASPSKLLIFLDYRVRMLSRVVRFTGLLIT